MSFSDPRRGCSQYSLRTCFVILTLSALLLAAVFAIPVDEAAILFLAILFPVPMVFGVCAIYSRGYLRTFAIGACFPALIAFLSPYFMQILYFGFEEFDLVHSPTLMRLLLLAYLVGAILVFLTHGALAVLVRWLVEPRQDQKGDTEHVVPKIKSPFDAETSPEWLCRS